MYCRFQFVNVYWRVWDFVRSIDTKNNSIVWHSKNVWIEQRIKLNIKQAIFLFVFFNFVFVFYWIIKNIHKRADRLDIII